MLPMLLRLGATLLQAFFPVLQDAGILNVHQILWRLVCQIGADFFFTLKTRKKFAFCSNQKIFSGMSF